MTSKENLIVYKSSNMQKENCVLTQNSEKELCVPNDMDKFSQYVEKRNLLENAVGLIESSDNKTTVITRSFYVPLEEEKYLIWIGEGRQEKFHTAIMEQTGANLEINFFKDQGLHVTVSGNSETVIKAQKEIFAWLQIQGFIKIPTPKEQHSFVFCNTRNADQGLEQNVALNTQNLCSCNQNNYINSVDTNEVMKIYPHKDLLMCTEQHKCATKKLNKKREYHPMTAESNSKTIVNITHATETTNDIAQFRTTEMEIFFNGKDTQDDQPEPYVETILENINEKTKTVDVKIKPKHNFTMIPECSSTPEIIEKREEILHLERISDSMTHQVEPKNSRSIFKKTHWKDKYYIFATISAPSWLHRFIIGKKGQNISKITQVVPKVHINFTAEDKITLKGPKDDVSYAQEKIEDIVKNLLSRMDYAEINIDYTFHKYLIEKHGAAINRIKEKNNVSLIISPEMEKKKILIRIEGEFMGVQQAKRELCELTATLEKEHTKDLIIEQKFHHKLIGKKGEQIHNIRKNFPNVTINFPDSGEKSDVVQLRGPKHELDKCTQYLENVMEDILESSYTITIPIFKQFHKIIIGKGGANIKKICLASNTKISFPSASSTSENIVITGKPENCELAHKMILSIQKDIANISEVEISIPSNIHKSLVDSKECLIGSILRECGKIHFTFPRNTSELQKVIIRGPAESVEKAKKKLLELTEEKQTKRCSVTLHVKPQYHQFLMSKTCGNISKICNETGAHVIFPTSEDRDQELLTITGTVEAVNDAKKELEALCEDLQNVIEDSILINPKYHPYFIMRRAQVSREISEEYGGVIISFPCLGEQSKIVTIKGAKPCVEAAKKHIQEIIGDLEVKVTTECTIPQKFHSFLLGPMCSRIQQITREYNVQIKFPDRKEKISTVSLNPATQENGKEMMEKTSKESASTFQRKFDTVLITGRKEKCEAAMKAIESLIPVTAEVRVPSDLHRYIVGQKGSRICKITNECDVQIQVSEPGANSDIISIKGPPANVEKAKAKLQERVKALHTEIEDRALRNFKLMMTIDPKYHPKIIGPKGMVVAQICQECNVTIHFPNKGNGEIQDQVIITGYKNNTLAAQEAILKIVHKIETQLLKTHLTNPPCSQPYY